MNLQALARTLTEPHYQNYVELAILGLLVAACRRSGASGPWSWSARTPASRRPATPRPPPEARAGEGT